MTTISEISTCYFWFHFVMLGFIGIFLPLLPTTPFLLLAVTCYSKSSNKFYHWLLNHKWLGVYIHSFRSKQGVPFRVKLKAIVVVWLSIGVSAYFFRDHIMVLGILATCASGITFYLLSLPTDKHKL